MLVGLAGAAGGVLLLTAMDEAVKEGAGGDDGGGGVDGAAVAKKEAGATAGAVGAHLEKKIDDLGLFDEEGWARPRGVSRMRTRVEGLVTLGAGTPDSGTTGGVEASGTGCRRRQRPRP